MNLTAAVGLCGMTGLILGSAAVGSAAEPTTEPLTESEFATLHRSLQPTGEEVWRTIPWEVSVLEAQARAGAEQKPLFIWAMDGHPLGCT